MKRKGERKRKKWHNGKKETRTNMRGALEAQVRSRHANPLPVPEGGRSSPPGSGPEASLGPSGSGSILRRLMNRILKQILNSTHLSEYLIILDASNFPHRITTRRVYRKGPGDRSSDPRSLFQMKGEGDMLSSFHGDRHVCLQG